MDDSFNEFILISFFQPFGGGGNMLGMLLRTYWYFSFFLFCGYLFCLFSVAAFFFLLFVYRLSFWGGVSNIILRYFALFLFSSKAEPSVLRPRSPRCRVSSWEG